MERNTFGLLISILIMFILPFHSCKKDEHTLPLLTTTNVSDISQTTAKSGGMVTNDGGSDIIATGICWNNSSNPTISNNKTEEKGNSVSFVANLTKLTPYSVYYVRAYATNKAGTGYGNQVTFTTSSIVTATLSTTVATQVTQGTVLTGATIKSDGGGAITVRGICWGTGTNPTVSGTHTMDGSGIGSFSSNISGLQPGTTYYYRSYAINIAGTAYGNELSFITQCDVPTVTTTQFSQLRNKTVTSGGNVTSDGGTVVTIRGVCWSTKTDPTVNDNKTLDGDGNGTFVSTISGLIPNTTYYLRAYASNSKGTGYGNILSFKTVVTNLPNVTTQQVSSITLTSAYSGGIISSDGGDQVSSRGVCWSTTANPTTANSKTSDGLGVGSFTSSISDLTPNTRYYVRAFATNGEGTAYGNEQSFTTNAITGATVTTITPASITSTTAVSGGNITNDGGSPITMRGVCWGSTSNPVVFGLHTADGTGTGTYSSSVIELTPGATYHIRAYATNSFGTAYGDDIQFLSLLEAPTINNTANITAITQTTATSGGIVTSDGGAMVTARGVCWTAGSVDPVITDSHTIDGAGLGTFSSSLSQLTPNTSYMVRAYATNSVGTSYGNVLSFNTSVALPTLSTTNISNITSGSASSGGNISSDGGSEILSRGVCWAATVNPTLNGSYTSDNIGVGTFISSISGLLPMTTYYVRSYATNIIGTSYGNQLTFTTSETLTDVDGNVYHIIRINDQFWLKENLKTTKLSDGSSLPLVPGSWDWSSLLAPAYCWYNDDPATYKDPYGALYNWLCVNTGLLCPSGWHVPSDTEWATLNSFLGGESVAGGRLKEAGIVHWESPNTGATNSTDFTALPGGYRYARQAININSLGYWWSSTPTLPADFNTAYSRIMQWNKTDNLQSDGSKTTDGFSVRCIRD